MHFLQEAGFGETAGGQSLKEGLRVFGVLLSRNCTHLGFTFKASHCPLYSHPVTVLPGSIWLLVLPFEWSGAAVVAGCEDGQAEELAES